MHDLQGRKRGIRPDIPLDAARVRNSPTVGGIPTDEIVLPDGVTNQIGAEEWPVGTTARHIGVSRSSATSVAKMTLSLESHGFPLNGGGSRIIFFIYYLIARYHY